MEEAGKICCRKGNRTKLLGQVMVFVLLTTIGFMFAICSELLRWSTVNLGRPNTSNPRMMERRTTISDVMAQTLRKSVKPKPMLRSLSFQHDTRKRLSFRSYSFVHEIDHLSYAL